MASHVILIDLDNTVVDTDGRLCELLSDYPEIVRQIRDRKDYKLPPEIKKKARFLMKQKGFFSSLKPYPHAIKTITSLCEEKYTIIFVSAPMRNNEYSELEKKRWIRNHFGEKWGPILADNSIMTRNKWLITGRFLIDDNDRQEAEASQYPHWELIVFDQSYNRSSEKRRLLNWRKDSVDELLKKRRIFPDDFQR